MSWAGLPISGFSRHQLNSAGLVLHQEGFDPVVMTPLADPISNRGGVGRDLEAFAERLGETIQGWPGQRADGAVELMDRGVIQRCQGWIGQLSIRGLRCRPPLYLTGVLAALPRGWAGDRSKIPLSRADPFLSAGR